VKLGELKRDRPSGLVPPKAAACNCSVKSIYARCRQENEVTHKECHRKETYTNTGMSNSAMTFLKDPFSCTILKIPLE
jgi:hypothetical protein